MLLEGALGALSLVYCGKNTYAVGSSEEYLVGEYKEFLPGL